MNKIAIPALLVATIMVAGAFAFMPVEQASTVHTTAAGQGVTSHVVVDVDFSAGDNYTLNCADDYVLFSISIFSDAGTIADETMDIDIGGDSYFDGVAYGTSETNAVFLFDGAVGVPGTDNVVLTNAAGTDDTDENWTITAALIGGGACLFTETT